jgi:hypothetical protein
MPPSRSRTRSTKPRTSSGICATTSSRPASTNLRAPAARPVPRARSWRRGSAMQLLLAQGEAAKPLNLELFRLRDLKWPIQVGISLYSEPLESLRKWHDRAVPCEIGRYPLILIVGRVRYPFILLSFLSLFSLSLSPVFSPL